MGEHIFYIEHILCMCVCVVLMPSAQQRK